MNFFITRSLYSAARVFVRTIKSLEGDVQTVDSLQCLISTMTAMKHTNPLIIFFLKEISHDMGGAQRSDPPLLP